MKPSTRISYLFAAAIALVWIDLFADRLGLPPGSEAVLFLMGIICFFRAYRISAKAKAAGQIPAATVAQKQKKFRVMVLACAVACVAGPFVLPLVGVGAPFWELAIASLLSFFMCTGVLWLTMKLKK